MAAETSNVAVVTGASRGIGRDLAIGLARDGWRVAVTARSADGLARTVESIGAAAADAIAVTADVTDPASVEHLIETTERELGPITLLVNNAGAGKPFGRTWEVPPDEWWRTVEVNLRGPMLCCSAAMRRMARHGRGRIVNVASGAGTVSIPDMSAYVASKTALIRLTEVLADEARSAGICLFAIQPGTVRTAMAEDAMPFLPWLRAIFDSHADDTTEHAMRLLLYIASGAADRLSGKFLIATDPAIYSAEWQDNVLRSEGAVLRLR
jgi:NAD(P)-dependent dehydrogenase (short-subunit alcohol dehydrogenase family)